MTKQVLIVFGICLGGIALSGFLPIPVPGSVLAMVGLLVLLSVGIVKEGSVQGLCDFLQNNMAFFFLPAGIGAIENLDVLKSSGLALAAVCAVGTLFTFAAAAFAVKLILKWQGKERGE